MPLYMIKVFVVDVHLIIIRRIIRKLKDFLVFNPYPAKFFSNFQPLEAMPRYREPQLQGADTTHLFLF